MLDVVQIVVATFSLILSLFLAYREYQKSKFSIHVEIKDYVKYQSVIQFFILIQNKSTQPISISSVLLLDDNSFSQCELLPKIIRKQGQHHFLKLQLSR